MIGPMLMILFTICEEKGNLQHVNIYTYNVYFRLSVIKSCINN